MYKVRCSLPENREPWNIPLEQRMQILSQARKQGKKIAAMLYHHADTSTFRYRCYNVYQATLQSGTWQCVYFFMHELEVLKKALPECTLLILARLKWEHAIDDLVRAAHERQIPVLFEIDDLVCNIRYLKLVTNTLNVHFGGAADYDFWFADFSRLQATASLADGFITTNDFLGNKLTERFGKAYQVIPNSLNEEQLKVSEACVQRKKLQNSQKPFTIGYFSGTPSHINDFKMIYREIMQLLEEHSDMVLQVVGFMEFPEAMQPLIQRKRVVFTPLVDFLELQMLIAQVDVNIVPLVQNTFTNCKSELKFFEAAAVETVTVATPNYTYANSVEDTMTGFLCRPGQWYDRILYLYAHAEERQKMAAAARAYCLNRYAGKNFLQQIETAYDFFAK